MTRAGTPQGAAGPGRWLWLAWGLTALGGAGFLFGLLLVLRDPCVDLATAEIAAACDGVSTEVVALTLGGTTVAVAGGVLAAVVSLRSRRPPGIGDDQR